MSTRKAKLSHWDAAEHLKSAEDCALYLEAITQEHGADDKLILAALGDIARKRGMTQVARDSGMTTEALSLALSPSGDPTFSTVLKVAHALGFRPAFVRSA